MKIFLDASSLIINTRLAFSQIYACLEKSLACIFDLGDIPKYLYDRPYILRF